MGPGGERGVGPVARSCEGDRPRAGHLVQRTLRAAWTHAGRHGVPDGAALGAGVTERSREPHPAAPTVGEVHVEVLTVDHEHTAAAIGHPDESVDVLSTPTLALWFELAGTSLMPPPGELRHVGVGVLVHHLAGAGVSDEVVVTAEVVEVDGRAVVFACHAHHGDTLLATGDYQRVLLDA